MDHRAILITATLVLDAQAHADPVLKDQPVDRDPVLKDQLIERETVERPAHQWLSVELPAAVPLLTAASGAMPAVGAYVDNGHGALGVRLRLGMVSDNTRATTSMSAPLATVGTVGVATRLGVAGGWVENVFGVAMTGNGVGPSIEAGLGFQFAVGNLDVGPSVRYVRVGGYGNIVLAGFDVSVGKRRHVALHPRIVSDRQVEPPNAMAADLDPACANDGTNCGAQLAVAIDSGFATVGDDRIVFDERMLFDAGHDEVHSVGRGVLAAIAACWHTHPEWRHIRIVANSAPKTDGDVDLTKRRIDHLSDLLVQRGFSHEQVDVATRAPESTSEQSVEARSGSDEPSREHIEFIIER